MFFKYIFKYFRDLIRLGFKTDGNFKFGKLKLELAIIYIFCLALHGSSELLGRPNRLYKHKVRKKYMVLYKI